MSCSTWSDAWSTLNKDGSLKERPGQTALGEWMYYITENGGTLLAEAPVGVGKSFGYTIPLINQVRGKYRAVVSTETTALQDQLYDKDLPRLHKLFGGFKYASLKGRNWYLCLNRANDETFADSIKNKQLGDGERRDVERILKRRLNDDEWDLISGDADYCAQRKCKSDRCWSTKARERAIDADLLVVNHSLLLAHTEYDIFGDFEHLVIDEAHTFERVVVDNLTFELSPYDLYKDTESIWKGIDAAYLSSLVPFAEEASKLAKDGIKSIVKLFTELAKYRNSDFDDTAWRRESFTLSLQYLSGNMPPAIVSALDEYELQGPGRFKAASEMYRDIYKKLGEALESAESGKVKIGKGRTAARRLSRVFEMVSQAMETRDAIVHSYGVPYAVLADGWKSYKGEYDVRIRCVPLDVSRDLRDNVWKGLKSKALLSGTLRDETDGSFRYVKAALGIDDEKTHELVVGPSFDYAAKQLVYVTDRRYEPVQVPGARYSMDEMVEVLEASNGRALVLFTANAEMEYAANELRNLQHAGKFSHKILVQERGVSKPELVKQFMENTSSVLLGSKSFFTGVDFPGESCSIVVLAKFPLPQYNALCRAQITWWRGRGFPKWYEREALQVFKQANGRLIRTETDHGVIAILDQRVADGRESVSKLTQLEVLATGSSITTDLDEVKRWLST